MTKNFLERIFWIETQLQLKHWQEKSGFHHEQLGSFYSEITEEFDKLVECYLGDTTKKVVISESLFKLENDKDINTIIMEIRKFLDELKEDKEMQERSLLNLIDEIYNDVERFSYLLNRK